MVESNRKNRIVAQYCRLWLSIDPPPSCHCRYRVRSQESEDLMREVGPTSIRYSLSHSIIWIFEFEFFWWDGRPEQTLEKVIILEFCTILDSSGGSMVEHLSSEQKVVGSSPIRSESCMSAWSSGMIPALGAGGPGFKSRSGPMFYSFWSRRFTPYWELSRRLGY